MTISDEATRRPRRGRRVAFACLAAAALVLLATIAWLGVRGVMAKGELDEVAALAGPVRTAVEEGDLDQVRDLAEEAHDHAGRAAALTGDVVWRAAEGIPFAGANLTAARAVSESIEAIARDALPLLDLAAGADDADDGASIAVVLAQAQAPLEQLSQAFARADDALSAVPLEDLIDPLRDPVATVSGLVGQARPAIEGAARAAAVLPAMLGADGPRTLLVMLQNEAELRTAGGIAGSFVLLQAAPTGLEIVDQADSSKFRQRDEPIAELPPGIVDLYGSDVGTYVQNTTLTPEFPLTASLVSAWWAEYAGTPPDGILSLDLTVLAALLDASGPLSLPDGSQISGDDLVQRVLVEPYFTLDSAGQTAFQEAVTSAAVERILAGGADPAGWLRALTAPIAEGRVSAWSPSPEEQAVIATTPFAGAAARHAAAGEDSYAVYFNDATGGKMDSFLDVAIATGAAQCRSDGRRDVTVAVTLTNGAPAEARTWPPLVTGGGMLGVAPGDIATDVAVAAPPGGFLGEVLLDGDPVLPADAVVAGFPTIRAVATVGPGQTRTLEFRFVDDDDRGEIGILHTPLLNAATVTEADVACP